MRDSRGVGLLMNNIAAMVRGRLQKLNEAPDKLDPKDFTMDTGDDDNITPPTDDNADGDPPADDTGKDGDPPAPEDGANPDDGDLDPGDFTMDEGDDDPDAADANDDDNPDDPGASTEDLPEEQNNEDETVRILELSDIDRTLAEKKLLSDFFDLNGMVNGLMKRTDRLRPILEAEDFNAYKDSVDSLSQTLTDYIAYKFRINSLEENGKNFALFTAKINVLIDEFKASFSKKGDNK